jgi:hypothetical protein
VHPKLPNTRSPTALPPVRFALYSAQELAAASESLLVDTFGDVDRRTPGDGLRADGVETTSAETLQATTEAGPSRQARVDTRSRYGNANSPSRS